MVLQLPGLTNLKRSNINKAISTLTNAFSDDPCLKYILNSEVYDYKKAAFLHRYSIELGLRYGVGFITSENAEGVSIWMPPKRTTTTTLMFIRAGGLSLRKKVDFGVIDRIIKYGNYSSLIHNKHAHFSHWYLLSIGVDKIYQGKGYLSRLMKPILKYFDENSQSCYLETHNEKNVAYYEKYGFKVVEIGCLPGTQKTHWAMLRIPAIKS